MKKSYFNQIYNIGSGKRIFLKDLFKKIAKIVENKIDAKIKFSHYTNKIDRDKSDYRNYQADISKAKINLKWKPKVLLDEGIGELINTGLENEKN